MIKKIFLLFYDKSFVYFLLIGGANTFLAAALMFGFYNVCGMGYWGASGAAFVICSVISYILNRRISFKSSAPVLSSAVKFSVVIAVCYFIAFGAARPLMFCLLDFFDITLQSSLAEQCAMLLAQGIFTASNFLGQKLWAFRG